MISGTADNVSEAARTELLLALVLQPSPAAKNVQHTQHCDNGKHCKVHIHDSLLLKRMTPIDD
jgi:hypothetical protein